MVAHKNCGLREICRLFHQYSDSSTRPFRTQLAGPDFNEPNMKIDWPANSVPTKKRAPCTNFAASGNLNAKHFGDLAIRTSIRLAAFRKKTRPTSPCSSDLAFRKTFSCMDSWSTMWCRTCPEKDGLALLRQHETWWLFRVPIRTEHDCRHRHNQLRWDAYPGVLHPNALCHVTSVCFDPDSLRTPSRCSFELSQPLAICRCGQNNKIVSMEHRALTSRDASEFNHLLSSTEVDLRKPIFFPTSSFPKDGWQRASHTSSSSTSALLAENVSSVYIHELDVASLSHMRTLYKSTTKKTVSILSLHIACEMINFHFP